MTLHDHATSELLRAGLFDADSDYEGNLAVCVMELIDVFAAQGHSGFSASWTLELFTKLSRFEALSPLSNDPDEWHEPADGLWQSCRNSEAFSHDGGKTYYLLSTGFETMYTAEDSK